MEKDDENYFAPGLPWVFVQKLTKDTIIEAVNAYLDDLKLRLNDRENLDENINVNIYTFS